MNDEPAGIWRRIFRQLFKGYQMMLLEPEGGHTVRNIRVNLASILSIVLILCMGSAALVWFYAPHQSQDLSGRYYQLQQQNIDQRDRLATGEGELAIAKEQINGLKDELQTSQQQIEELRQARTVYESILEARKSAGVRILRASASLGAINQTSGLRQMNYSIILVKGGNYPRSVSGSVHIKAMGVEGQQTALILDKKTKDLTYRMDTHAFLEGNVIWKQDWLPVKLQITRRNAKGAERDQMEIDVDGGASGSHASESNTPQDDTSQ
ncbi:MAG: hypothetical protein Q9M23_06495 [Mariprofundaceae bacterium]|nr:hypothetical protein [Mariprofundaceae bacterium]